jgi:hypothetical protein
VIKYGGVPPYEETQNYVTRVLHYYGRYRSTSDVVIASAGRVKGREGSSMTASIADLAKRFTDIVPLKPPVDPATLTHKQLVDMPDFRRIPAYKDVTDEQFLDHHWQAKKSITRPDKLLDALRGSCPRTSSRTRPRASPTRR